jgi:hypothetical protein
MMVTGTVVKEWFQYACERKARYASMDKDVLRNASVEAVPRVRPWAVKGVKYEERIMSGLGHSLLRPSGQTLRRFLSGEMPGLYATQVDLRPRGLSLGLPKGVGFGSNLPDLIRHGQDQGKDRFTLIDIKATRRATRFHKAQVALYAILLDEYLAEGGLPGRAAPEGEIWRIPDDGSVDGGAYQAEVFDLAPYRRMVLEFLMSVAPDIGAPVVDEHRDETPFHVYFKCEECAYLEKRCAASVSAGETSGRDVSAVAGMSHHAKRQLAARGISTVGALAAAKGITQADEMSWSLRRKLGVLVQRAEAIRSGRPSRTAEPYSMLMPGKVDTRILLSVDVDPIDDMLVALGCVVERADGTRTEAIAVISSSDWAEEVSALKRVFGAVLGELQSIAAHNDRLDPSDASAIVAHLYLYEPSEALALQAAVKRHIDDQGVRSALLEMVRMFPPDNVVAEPEYRGANHLPATAVRSVVEHLYALPVNVSYDLRQVTRALADAGLLQGPYEPSKGFERAFSSLLSIEVARGIKGEGIDGFAISTQQVADDVRARLRALSGLCEWLERESARNATPDGGALLRLPKKPFRFWRQFDPLSSTDLDILLAFELMQSRANMLATLVGLARPPAARTASGGSLTGLSYVSHWQVGYGRMAIEFSVPRETRDTEVGPGTFGLVVTNGAYDVLLDPLAWPDFECSVSGTGSSGSKIVVEMRKANFDSPEFQAMLRMSRGRPDWCLDKILKDPNTARIADFLKYLAEGS